MGVGEIPLMIVEDLGSHLSQPSLNIQGPRVGFPGLGAAGLALLHGNLLSKRGLFLPWLCAFDPVAYDSIVALWVVQ